MFIKFTFIIIFKCNSICNKYNTNITLSSKFVEKEKVNNLVFICKQGAVEVSVQILESNKTTEFSGVAENN